MEMVRGEYEEDLKYNTGHEKGPEGQALTRNKNRNKVPLPRRQMASPAQAMEVGMETGLVGGVF